MREFAVVVAVTGLLLAAAVAVAEAASAKPLRAEFTTSSDMSWGAGPLAETSGTNWD
jgi:hypothetical protein